MTDQTTPLNTKQTTRRQTLQRLGALAFGSTLLSTPLALLAQTSDKVVRFILPVGAGSGVDCGGRDVVSGVGVGGVASTGGVVAVPGGVTGWAASCAWASAAAATWSGRSQRPGWLRRTARPPPGPIPNTSPTPTRLAR